MFDGALEQNRRVAWAKFFRARADCEQVQWWAAELADWCDVLAGERELPPQLRELMGLVRAPLSPRDRAGIARYVQYHSELVASTPTVHACQTSPTKSSSPQLTPTDSRWRHGRARRPR